jgi:hypothetical protein
MMSVLLLTFTVSTGFVSNTYQKAYAAEDFPTSDLSPKIREWINNQMREDLFTPSSSPVPMSSQEVQSITLTLSGFPRQTGESVTNIDLRPSPCRVDNDITCNGFSNIMIPGIGELSASALVIPIPGHSGQPQTMPIVLLVIGVLLVFLPSLPIFGPHTRTIYIPGIGSGQATVQLS